VRLVNFRMDRMPAFYFYFVTQRFFILYSRPTIVRMAVKAVIVMDQAMPKCMYPSKEKSQVKYMTVSMAAAMHPMARIVGFSR
jgi:hypothetical protein